MVTTIQLCLIIGSPTVAVILTALDLHFRTNRLIAKIDRMCEDKPDVSDIDYRRQWEAERLIFEERIRQTYQHRI